MPTLYTLFVIVKSLCVCVCTRTWHKIFLLFNETERCDSEVHRHGGVMMFYGRKFSCFFNNRYFLQNSWKRPLKIVKSSTKLNISHVHALLRYFCDHPLRQMKNLWLLLRTCVRRYINQRVVSFLFQIYILTPLEFNTVNIFVIKLIARHFFHMMKWCRKKHKDDITCKYRWCKKKGNWVTFCDDNAKLIHV